MSNFYVQPPGVSPLNKQDRKHIIRVISGDTWTFPVNLTDPVNPWEPATPEETYVEVILAETQFDKPIWHGEWYNGIIPDAKRNDLAWVKVPNDLTKSLRRGSYMFSIRVSDLLKTNFRTEIEGSILVEYKPTSEQHSIPYKDEEEDKPIPPEPPPVPPFDPNRKADKVIGAITGDIAILNSEGNLVDSGKKPEDFASAHALVGKEEVTLGDIAAVLGYIDSSDE